MHEAARSYVEDQVRRYGPFNRVLEFGSRNVNGGIRDLFTGLYLGVDAYPGPGVDVVADASDFVANHSFDAVVCCEVLEHTPRAPDIIVAAYRNLKRGGRLILTTAARPRWPHSAIDGCALRADEYYSNIEVPTMEAWLKAAGFSGAEVDVIQLPNHGGDLRATAWR